MAIADTQLFTAAEETLDSPIASVTAMALGLKYAGIKAIETYGVDDLNDDRVPAPLRAFVEDVGNGAEIFINKFCDGLGID